MQTNPIVKSKKDTAVITDVFKLKKRRQNNTRQGKTFTNVVTYASIKNSFFGFLAGSGF